MGLAVGSVRTQATVRLSLFPVVGALEVYRANLRLHARGSGRTASLNKLFVVISNYERIS